MIFLSHDKGVKKTSFLCLGVVGFYKNKYYLITTKETGDKYPFVESVVPQLRVGIRWWTIRGVECVYRF